MSVTRKTPLALLADTAEPLSAAATLMQHDAAAARRLYVAGPMTGLPEHNYPAFRAAAAALRAVGYEVESPAEPGQVHGWGWTDYMKRGLAQMLTCDGVALLPGWTESKGACIEADIASLLGVRLWGVDEWIKAVAA